MNMRLFLLGLVCWAAPIMSQESNDHFEPNSTPITPFAPVTAPNSESAPGSAPSSLIRYAPVNPNMPGSTPESVSNPLIRFAPVSAPETPESIPSPLIRYAPETLNMPGSMPEPKSNPLIRYAPVAPNVPSENAPLPPNPFVPVVPNVPRQSRPFPTPPTRFAPEIPAAPPPESVPNLRPLSRSAPVNSISPEPEARLKKTAPIETARPTLRPKPCKTDCIAEPSTVPYPLPVSKHVFVPFSLTTPSAPQRYDHEVNVGHGAEIQDFYQEPSQEVIYLDEQRFQVDQLLNQFAQAIQKGKGLIPVSRIVDIDTEGNVSKVGLYFESFQHLTIYQARNLILSVVRGLISQVNANATIKPFLAQLPMPVENFDVRIEFVNKSDDFSHPKLGNIALVTFSDGIISYGTMNSFNYHVDLLRSEQYKHAVELDESR